MFHILKKNYRTMRKYTMHACDDLSFSYLVPYDMDLFYIKCWTGVCGYVCDSFLLDSKRVFMSLNL